MTTLDYRRKIKSREDLQSILGPRPRERSVILCHGTFDLVHPGHIRHLLAAKEHADILVVSITCDARIAKADHRPLVPQSLRAMNLAALEAVNYVLIDNNADPRENIAYLQPDCFAKGGEYGKGGLHPKTAAEVEVLATYGGRLVLTPDDVVFSSSRFIEESPPDLAIEKLLSLMESTGVTFAGLRAALESMRGIRVHVVGDTIVDSLTTCTPLAGHAHTSAPSVKLENQVDAIGGAAIVAKHLHAAGAEVIFSTVLGTDPLGTFVRDDLCEHGIQCEPCLDASRPTTQKNVYLAGRQRLLKVDRVDNRPIADAGLHHLQESLARHRADAVIFSDFRHGIFSRHTIPALIARMPAGALTVADSQVASRWGNILDFQGFDLIAANELEARFALGDQDSLVRALATDLQRRSHCQTLILKLGERGLLTCPASGSPFALDTFARDFTDATGAGDALLAYGTLALVATRCPVVASILGSLAAATICERDVNRPVAPAEILSRLETLEKRACYSCVA